MNRKLYAGWKGYTGAVGLLLAGAGMLWWSMRPGMNPAVATFLQAQAITAIPAGLALLGIRHNQERMERDLKRKL